MDSVSPSPRNFCGICGATSYRKVITRDASGAMRPTGRLRCTGCEREYLDVQAWRESVPLPVSPETGMNGTYLTSSFRDKDRVKALGARWDPAQRQWYVPDGLALTHFAE